MVLDIGTSTSSNESHSDEEEVDDLFEEEFEEGRTEDDQDDDDDNDNDDEDLQDEDEDEVHELHSNDWEVKMLVAELEKRESKSSVDVSDVDESDGLLRRRRKRSYTTDPEFSDTDTHDPSLRPRAGSLDQVNLKRREKQHRGVFKAMSFDRDKDKL